ncbi:MAG: SpoIIE family protein phosphatase [Deltaproteobacteria bacterium]|nr:SpoIIE family protein phosphatase [Deltaproteobacteria bacterium]
MSLAIPIRSTSAFEIGAVCRSLLLGDVSGDAWDAIAEGDCLTVVVADGVGHGKLAHEASSAAVAFFRETLERSPMTKLDVLMRMCNDVLRGTRGAAIGLCRFDPTAGIAAYCGVGNTCFLRYPHRRGLGVSLPGTVGCMMRSVRVFETTILPGDYYAFHTDGVSSSMVLEGYVSLSPQLAAERALSDHGKAIDDATIVMVRYAGWTPPSD